VQHKGFLNGAEESNSHSSYGLGRNYITYITKATLHHLGAIILVELHIASFHSVIGGLGVDPIGVRVRDIASKDTMFRFGFVLSRAHTFYESVALASKHTKIRDIGLVSGGNFIKRLVKAFIDRDV
jgi:hypothetical protein